MKQVNKQELEQIVKESSSYADVCRAYHQEVVIMLE